MFGPGLKGKGAPAAAAASDDRLYAFEAAGLLLGMEDLPAEEQREAVSALLRPLLAQMEEQLTVAGKAAAGAHACPHTLHLAESLVLCKFAVVCRPACR